MPGLVDSHVHVNEPGHTDWEGFATATAAAAAGGITTLIDMPLNSIPVTVDRRRARDQEASSRRAVSHRRRLSWAALSRGTWTSFCRFTTRASSASSASSPTRACRPSHPSTSRRCRRPSRCWPAATPPCSSTPRTTSPALACPPLHSRRYTDYLASRPRGYENLAIAQVIEAARLTGGRAHICHLSSSDALSMIESARRDAGAAHAWNPARTT